MTLYTVSRGIGVPSAPVRMGPGVWNQGALYLCVWVLGCGTGVPSAPVHGSRGVESGCPLPLCTGPGVWIGVPSAPVRVGPGPCLVATPPHPPVVLLPQPASRGHVSGEWLMQGAAEGLSFHSPCVWSLISTFGIPPTQA